MSGRDFTKEAHANDPIYALPRLQKVQPEGEGLADLEHYLLKLLQSSAPRRSVWVHSPYQPEFTIGIIQANKKSMISVLIFMAGRQETAVREVLNEAKIKPQHDDLMPAGEGPCQRFIGFCLPIEFAGLKKIIYDVLQKGCGEWASMTLEFRYREKDTQ